MKTNVPKDGVILNSINYDLLLIDITYYIRENFQVIYMVQLFVGHCRKVYIVLNQHDRQFRGRACSALIYFLWLRSADRHFPLALELHIAFSLLGFLVSNRQNRKLDMSESTSQKIADILNCLLSKYHTIMLNLQAQILCAKLKRSNQCKQGYLHFF